MLSLFQVVCVLSLELVSSSSYYPFASHSRNAQNSWDTISQDPDKLVADRLMHQEWSLNPWTLEFQPRIGNRHMQGKSCYSRCALCADAVVTRLCAGAQRLPEITLLDKKVFQFFKTLESIEDETSYVLDMQIWQENHASSTNSWNDPWHIGHEFVLHRCSDGSFYWYQCFIGQYCLSDWMNKTSSVQPYTLEAFSEKMRFLKLLNDVTTWGAAENAAYANLFDVDVFEQLDSFWHVLLMDTEPHHRIHVALTMKCLHQ